MKPSPPLETLILTLRQQKVILDADLAALFGVPTKRLNEQAKRNAERFPADFMFQLSVAEWRNLRSQSATSSSEQSGNELDARNWSQIATGSQRHRDPRLRPYAFTEHGALMAADVLNSPEAVTISLYVVRVFIQMRGQMYANAVCAERSLSLG